MSFIEYDREKEEHGLLLKARLLVLLTLILNYFDMSDASNSTSVKSLYIKLLIIWAGHTINVSVSVTRLTGALHVIDFRYFDVKQLRMMV
jgi:hypothetical protein